MNNDQTISLSLTIPEANIVMAGLGKLPFEAVFEVIGKIRQQAEHQIQQTQQMQQPEPSEG